MRALLTLDPRSRLLLRELARFETTKELEQSSSFQKLRRDIERVLGQIWQEDLAPKAASTEGPIRVIAWNIERGRRVDAIASILQEHPSLQKADVLLLSEL